MQQPATMQQLSYKCRLLQLAFTPTLSNHRSATPENSPITSYNASITFSYLSNQIQLKLLQFFQRIFKILLISEIERNKKASDRHL